MIEYKDSWKIHILCVHKSQMLLLYMLRQCYYTFCYMLLHYITLDLYYDVLVALTNPLSNTGMTDFFMLSYIASLP